MGRNRSPKKPLGRLFEAGISALVLGAALSFVPRFFANPAPAEAPTSVILIASWCLAAIGVVLLVLHFAGRRGADDAAHSKHDPEWASQLPTDLLRRHPRGFDHTETPPITRSLPTERPARPASRPGRKT
jgi:hypothetical protein